VLYDSQCCKQEKTSPPKQQVLLILCQKELKTFQFWYHYGPQSDVTLSGWNPIHNLTSSLPRIHIDYHPVYIPSTPSKEVCLRKAQVSKSHKTNLKLIIIMFSILENSCKQICNRVLIIKPTSWTNFSKFIFGIKLYIFRTVPLPIIRSFSLYTQQWYMSYRFAACVQWKTTDDGQRNCPKHVQFYSKNKFWEISASSWFSL
jgi:hypothetical protein